MCASTSMRASTACAPHSTLGRAACFSEGRWSPARTEGAIFTLVVACEILILGHWAVARLAEGHAQHALPDQLRGSGGATRPQTPRESLGRKTAGSCRAMRSRSPS